MMLGKLAWLGVLAMGVSGVARGAEAVKEAQKTPVAVGEAAGKMTLPEGFTATLFAGEPDIHQPIGFTMDHRGRLWVAENFSYPKYREKGPDRIVILEDTDGDGKFDKKTVFAEGFHFLSGLELGNGGIYVMSAPQLLFIPIKEGEDKPAGEAQVLLEGWSVEAKHNLCNSLTWGPDGWLYGCNGILAESVVGAPGTTKEQRTKINCGVWRFHPARKTFEVYAVGTTNPWGLDFDEHGQWFMSNNVLAHLWHVIPGAHYHRMYGKDYNPYAYEVMESIADHLHWGGGDWTKSRGGEGVHSEAGGGHSHAGFMLYQGDGMPADYRGTAFMCNTHGNRVNNDRIERKGSGFVASHRPDLMLANDKWFRGTAVHYGPDGAIYVSDWSDTGECHQYDHPDVEHGRIYKITWKGAKKNEIDLTKASDEKLVELQSSTNEWMVRHARQMLHDRGLKEEQKAALTKLMTESKDGAMRLRGLWALQTCGGVSEEQLLKLLGDSDEYVRAWGVQLLVEGSDPSAAALEKFAAMAKGEESALVRLYLASAMQRTPVEKRMAVLEGLIGREGDATDQNLPFMYWYALEPVIGADKKSAAAVLGKIKIAKVREWAVRRMASK